jgi:hypothetical protein
VSDDRQDLAVSDEFLGYFRSDGSVAFIVASDYLESMAVDAASLIDFFGRQLHTLEVL